MTDDELWYGIFPGCHTVESGDLSYEEVYKEFTDMAESYDLVLIGVVKADSLASAKLELGLIVPNTEA
jgi:hypothetical protein